MSNKGLGARSGKGARVAARRLPCRDGAPHLADILVGHLKPAHVPLQRLHEARLKLRRRPRVLLLLRGPNGGKRQPRPSAAWGTTQRRCKCGRPATVHRPPASAEGSTVGTAVHAEQCALLTPCRRGSSAASGRCVPVLPGRLQPSGPPWRPQPCRAAPPAGLPAPRCAASRGRICFPSPFVRLVVGGSSEACERARRLLN